MLAQYIYVVIEVISGAMAPGQGQALPVHFRGNTADIPFFYFWDVMNWAFALDFYGGEGGFDERGQYFVGEGLDLAQAFGPGDILVVARAAYFYELEHAFVDDVAEVEEGADGVCDGDVGGAGDGAVLIAELYGLLSQLIR